MSKKIVGNGANKAAPGQQHHVQPHLISAEGAQVVTPGPADTVTLPEGTTIATLEAYGRDLLIVLSNGEKIIIPDGAVVVPQIVVDNAIVPPANIAALLIDNEVQPAAGPAQSSGGNFATAEGAIQAAYGLGNLLPYTELHFQTQPTREIFPGVVNHPPTIEIETPDNPAGATDATATVYEAGLPARNGEPAGTGEAADGNPSNNSDPRETTTGTIVFNAPDGVKSVLIGGTAIDHVGQAFGTGSGTITITSIDLSGGKIGFSYTLADNLIGQSDGGNVQMTIVDSDGDQATATLHINVVDDAPIAANDTDAVAAGTYGPETGNVITGAGTTSGTGGADRVGADNASVTSVSHNGNTVSAGAGGMVIAGDYGTLSIHDDGSYSYVRSAGTPGGVSDQFTYTLTDGDGSTASATLTIQIDNSPVQIISVPEIGDGTIVYEHGLPPHTDGPVGSVEGADGNPFNNSDPSEATNGTITFSAPDGPATVEINDTVITGPGQVVAVPDGTLTITGIDTATGTLDYTFTLTENTSGDNTSVTFTVKVTDVDGDSASAPFTIHIVDDVPTAHADSGSVNEGDATSGDVVANDVAGADGFAAAGAVTGVATGSNTASAVTGHVGSDLAGTYGTLHLNADGSYTYTANPDAVTADATDHFVYTVTDGDGDTSTTTLDITVHNVTLAGDDQTKTVSEAALDLNKDGSDLAAGTVTGSNPASTAETVTGTLAVAGATSYTLVGSATGSHGLIQLNSNGSYTYTLTSPVDNLPHADDGNDTTHPGETFTYLATDAHGNTTTGTITIDIVDDVPTAHADSGSVNEGDATSGDVVANDVAGADGFAAAGAVTGVATGSNTASAVTGHVGSDLAGTYGTLHLNADGSYTYTANPDAVTADATDHFVYTVTDGDGDTSTTTLDITVHNVTLAGDDQTKTVSEAALDLNKDGSDLAAGTVTGSNPASTAETVTGTLAVAGATSYTLVGSATGSHGLIQLNSNGSYTYTLTSPVDNLPHADDGNDTTHPGETFTYLATDAHGNTTTGTITIDIVDDVPTAHADSGSVNEGDATSGDVVANDVAGADGFAAAGAVTGVATGSNTASAVTGHVGSDLAGTYGTLHLNADGSYTYTANPDAVTADATDHFVYTVTDGDGDTSTTTLDITVHNVTLAGDDQTKTVSEAALDLNKDGSDLAAGTVTGSNPASTAETVTGTLAVAGATSYTLVGSATGSHGLIQLNSNGSYTYTLTSPVDNLPHADDGNDTTHPGETFTYLATDAHGNTTTGTITIDIVDDVPTAHADSGSVNEGDATSGDVVANDVAGADGFAAAGAVTGVATGSNTASAVTGHVGSDLAGTYGTLHLNADGSYTYTANPDAVTADATDHFVYTVTDGDGDTSTTTLDITVHNVTLAGDDQTKTVSEAALDLNKDGSDLAAGTVTGSNPASTAETVTGTLAVAGATSYTLVGSATGSHGLIQLNSNGSYTYTLTSPVDNLPHADDGNDTTHPGETFTYLATDAHGNTTTGTITIDIVDDVPTAHADSGSVNEGDATSGDVVANDVAGADGFAAAGAVTGVATGSNTASAVTGHVGSDLAGTYGTLHLNADGSYTYTANPDAVTADATDHFVYTVTDGDGDTSTTTLDITVHNVTLAGDDQTKTVSEAALDLNKDGSDLAAGTVTGSNPASTAETVTGTLAVAGATSYTLVGSATGSHGLIQLNSNGSYTYTLTSPVDNLPHADDGNDTTHPGETFTYLATDAHGNTTTGTITIDIVDDVPTAHADSGSVNEGDATSGDVVANDVAGADGFAAAGAVTGVATGSNTASAVTGHVGSDLAGTYGTLHLNADGSYTYTANPDAVTADATDHFVYTVTDGDGDTSTTTLDITVHNVTLAGDDQTKTVSEAALDLNKDGSDLAAGTVTGSNPASTAETVTGTLAVAGATSYTLVGSATGSHGLIQLNSNGSYTYTLTSPVDNLPHADDGNDTTHPGETFTYLATDAHGNTTTGTITIDIVDDVPTAHADSGSVNEGDATSGDVVANDVAGADGFAAAGAVTGVATGSNTASAVTGHVGSDLAGTYGTLHLNADGSYTYTANPDAVTADATDHFVYTVTDGDGDTSTTTLDITVHNVTLAGDDQTKTVSEAALDLNKDGSDLAAGTVTGSNPASTAETVTGTLAVAGATSYTLVGSATGSHGLIQLNSNGSYTYTLTSPVDNLPHADDGNDTTHPGETFTYLATDAHGNTTTGTITIDIVDDVPTAHADSGSVNEGDATSGDVVANDVAGADGFAAAGAVTGVATGSNTASAVTGHVGSDLAGTYGTLHLNADGSYTYTANPDAVTADATDHFVYTVTDGDGDTSTTTLDITVHNVTLAGDNESVTVYEKGLDTSISGNDVAAGTVTGSMPNDPGETATGAVSVAGAASYSISGGTVNGNSTTVVGTYGTLVINNATGAYTYTLTSPYTTAPSANDGATTKSSAESFTYTATDAHGNTTTGTISVNIVDDIPVAVAADPLSLNNAASTTTYAYLDSDHNVSDNYGADGPGAVIFTAATITTLQSQNLTSGFTSLNYAISNDGTTLTATKATDSSVVFTIDLQPTGHANQYQVTIDQALDSKQTVAFSGGGYNFVGGNGSWAGFNQPSVPNSHDLLLTPVGGGTVNTNANDGGIAAGNSVGSGEAMRVDYVIDLTGSPVSGGNFYGGDDTQNFTGHYTINGGSALFTSITGSSTVSVKAFDDNDSGTVKNVGDGSADTVTSIAINFNHVQSVISSNGTYSVGGHSFTVTFNGDGTANVSGVVSNTTIAAYTADGYDSVQWGYVSGDTFKIGDFGASIVTHDPVSFTAPISIEDGDGDIVSSGSLSVTANPVTAPVVLDLNGDGLHFLGLDAGVSYDYGHGAVHTAWVAPDDGLLAHVTASGLDIVFTDDAPGAKTDLQGLALAYDSNHDGQLTSADAAWSSFGVWQDANSNGVVDPGEFKTLSQAGISAISLTTDGHAYSAAGGDVAVLGTGSFTKTDGTTSAIGDSAFATASQQISQQTSELSAAAAALGGFLAVPLVHAEMAAGVPQSGLAKLAAIAMADSEPTTLDVPRGNGPVNPAAIDLTSQHTSDAPLTPTSSGGSHEVFGSENPTLPEASHTTVTTEQLPMQAAPTAETTPVNTPHGPTDVAVMNALLAMNHTAPAGHSNTAGTHSGNVTTQDMPKVAAVLHDALAGHTIDQIVDKFAGGHELHNRPSGDASPPADGHVGTLGAGTAHGGHAPAVLDLHVDAHAAGHAAFFAAMAAMPIVEEHVMAHA